jgi:peptidyl-prolyl cis-trans isomerase A (cyclophilin A)
MNSRPLHKSRALALLGLVTALAASAPTKPAPASVPPAAPDSFRVTFETSRGTFVVMVNRKWAPLGVDRFRELVDKHFFDGARFFRVVPGFVAQFGLAPDPKNNIMSQRIMDDPVRHSNLHGTLTFAHMGPNTRSQQLYFNLRDNAQLDAMGFPPIGRVISGIKVMDALFSGYGEAPDQDSIMTKGNAYLQRVFPKLDYIKTARVTPAK